MEVLCLLLYSCSITTYSGLQKQLHTRTLASVHYIQTAIKSVGSQYEGQ